MVLILKSSKLKLIVFTIVLFILSVICLLFKNESKSKDKIEEEKVPQEVPQEVEKLKEEHKVETTQIEIVEETKFDEYVYEFSEEDEYLLLKIAMAEAERESTEGKALVMLVVLNRVKDNRFPNTIHDVIYQKNQFSPVESGVFEQKEPSDDCYQALEMVKRGWDESYGALYFESCVGNPWEGSSITYLFTVGGHDFYN